MNRFVISYQKAVILCIVTVFVTGSGQGLHTGIGGDANSQGDVTIAGCTCHAEQPDNSVTVVLDGIPYHYGLGQEYELRVQLIGGPAIDTTSQTGGFAMRVSSGTLGPGTGYDLSLIHI